jgi:hypothetical protein
MGKKLGAKHQKRRRDQATAYAKGQAPADHKVAVERSKRALKKKAFRMA